MRSVLLVVLAAAAAALSGSAATAHEYILWIPTPQRFEGTAPGGKHLDAALSADGRKVVDLRLSGITETCRYPGGAKHFKAGGGMNAMQGSALPVNAGRFKQVSENRAYGNYFRTTLSGKVSGGGRFITATSTIYGRQKMLVKGRMVQATCTAKGTGKALRWAPADWTGKTSQGQAISFHVGAFSIDQKATITNLRGAFQVTCDDGQTRLLPFDAASDAGTLTYSDQIIRKVATLNLSTDSASSYAEMKWAKTAGSIPSLGGKLEFQGLETDDTTCAEATISFSAKPVG